ncbi:MAG: polysaccharide biosynthesis C-terminal domain-containing protein [Planctomycetia bacterium]|nr:polysaccharide biosynthesis C-terminal domain-containing protein [Planctomycetia bacterium]
MTTTSAAGATPPPPRKLPPVLGRLLSGTFWLALRTPLQAVFALWTIPLILQAIGPRMMDAYLFAWGFGFFQMLFELGMSSALQRQVAENYTRGDRAGVDRAIACGMNFYAAMALVQIAALVAVAYLALPYFPFRGEAYRLIVRLLWLQAVTAPCYGLSAVVSSVLQAARRYDFQPRFELAVIVLRFAVLWAGVNAGVDFFTIVVTQTVVQIVLALAPALWVMAYEIGHVPGFRGARRDDYRALAQVSFYVFMIQLSVVLADKLDTIILGFAIRPPDGAISVYNVASKPFLQIRQTGWTLTYMVMPAVASLIAARDERSLDRLKYDGTRLLVGAILPVTLLAWVHAGPFLTLWVGDKLGYDAGVHAGLLRLFLVGTVPLVLSVPVQMAIGMNRPRVIGVSALAGALVNLPLSYYLTLRMGVSGVIWGTVLTTLFSNLLVPGVYVFRVLDIRPRRFLARTLSAPAAGGLALVVAALALRAAFPLHPSPAGGLSLTRWLPLAAHLAAGCLAYAVGYLAAPAGRADLIEAAAKFRHRPAAGELD